MPSSTYYELKMYVPPTDPELVQLYVKAADKQNSLVDNCQVAESCKHYDAGFDLFTPQEGPYLYNCVQVNHLVRCAMRFYSPECPEGRNVGYYLYCRSSTATKTTLRLANSVGIIDAGYRGDIIAVFDDLGVGMGLIKQYQRLVQLCPPNLTYPFRVTLVDTLEDLGETARGNNGFGSTGQ
jgi:dUTPase